MEITDEGLAALITAVLAVLMAVYNIIMNKRQQKELSEHQSTLERELEDHRTRLQEQLTRKEAELNEKFRAIPEVWSTLIAIQHNATQMTIRHTGVFRNEWEEDLVREDMAKFKAKLGESDELSATDRIYVARSQWESTPDARTYLQACLSKIQAQAFRDNLKRHVKVIQATSVYFDQDVSERMMAVALELSSAITKFHEKPLPWNEETWGQLIEFAKLQTILIDEKMKSLEDKLRNVIAGNDHTPLKPLKTLNPRDYGSSTDHTPLSLPQES